MGLTLDNVLTVFQLTISYPIIPLLLLAASIFFKAAVWTSNVEKDFSIIGSIWPLSIQNKIVLGWAAFALILQWNQAWNRKSLNPSPPVPCNWPGELIVVTGGSGGIGGELVKQLDKLGATVVIMDMVPPTFNTSKQVHYFRTDVTSFQNITQSYNDIVAKLGFPSILVANAGVFRGKTVLDASEKDLRTTFDVNVLGALFCIKAFLPSMITENKGHILVTSSVKAYISAAGSVDYSASKAALASIVEGLQTELKHKYGNPKVKVSAVFPAVVNTSMTKGIGKVMHSFVMPILEPELVAERMLQVLLDGESTMMFLPALSHVGKWLHAMPYWVRVGIQDASARALDYLSIGNDATSDAPGGTRRG